MTDGEPTKRSYAPQSLAKAFAVLDCFDDAHPQLTAAQLERRLDMRSSTLYRYLAVLETAGFVERIPGTARYALGLRLAELGGIALNRLEVRRHGQPLLESLADASGMNANLAVLYRGDVFHIAYAVRSEVDQLYTLVGRRTPAHCTSLGRAMLARLPWEEVRASIDERGWRPLTRFSPTSFEQLEEELARTRERGYAVDDGAVAVDTYCVGATVYAQGGEVAAAISLSGPFVRFIGAEVERLAGHVVHHADMLSRRLGHVEPLSQAGQLSVATR